MKNLKLISLALFVFIGTVNGQQLEISKVNLPNLSGERSLTFDCPLDGNQKKDVEVWVYYSTNKEQLSEKNCPRGRATCKKSNDPNKMNCTFYFPHKDHMKPNKLHDSEINGGEPPSDDEMAELLEKYSEFEIFKKLNGDNAEKVFPKHYEAFKKLNNTDKNEVSINNPKKVYYKIERVKFKFKNNVDPNIIMKEESIYSTINEFTMPRVFTIGYMGDSFTSGEGAPYSGEDKWDDNLCHRSNKSGGMRAINKLIERRRDLVVRVINTTCSGAKIGNLINQPQHSAAAIYYPNKKNSTKYSQLDLIADWLKTNNRETVDIMLMGIGGNNIGFAEMATAASNPVRNPITWERDALAAIEDAKDLLKDLPNAYDVLNTAINNQDFEVGKILIMNYPNMLFGKNGKICDGTNTSPPACLDPTNFLFTHREAFKDIHHSLNDEVTKAAERNNWEVIRVSAINKHGMCNCEEPYFNTWLASNLNQGDESGSVHPNADGYQELYRDNVYAALKNAIPEAQLSDWKIRIEEARADAKAKLKKDQEKKIAKELARKKLQEKLTQELPTKAETFLKAQKVEMPKQAQPAKVNLKHNDDPRPKSNNDDKD